MFQVFLLFPLSIAKTYIYVQYLPISFNICLSLHHYFVCWLFSRNNLSNNLSVNDCRTFSDSSHSGAETWQTKVQETWVHEVSVTFYPLYMYFKTFSIIFFLFIFSFSCQISSLSRPKYGTVNLDVINAVNARIAAVSGRDEEHNNEVEVGILRRSFTKD